MRELPMAISTELETLILKVTVGLFNAAPGGTNLTEMSNLVEGGMTIAQLADGLAAHPLFTGSIMAGKVTTDEQVEVLMNHFGLTHDGVAGSAATQAEEYFAARIDAGDGFGAIVYDAVMFLSGSVPAEFEDAAALLANKAAVAEAYSSDNSSSDLAVLQGILSGVTADGPSTPEEIDTYLDSVVSGDTFTLTTGQDTVVAGDGRDTIKGVFGSATASENTYTAGDDIDGGAGSLDKLELTAQGTTASSGAVTVTGMERITINDSVGATFNALSVADDPSITFNGTINGQTSTVTNAALGSVIGLVGEGDLTVDYLTTSGTTDTANLSLAGVGIDEDDRSEVDVANGDTIEGVTIATTGTNFVELDAGSDAATLTVTGDGTNNFDLSAAGAVASALEIDASAATGGNTFLLGTTLNTVDTITGGSGDDSIDARITGAALIKPTITGIETYDLEVDAAANINLDNSSDVATINLTDNSADMTVSNADETLATVNVVSMETEGHDLTVGYRNGMAGDLTLNIGSEDNEDFEFSSIDINNAGSVALNILGGGHSAGAVTIDDDLTTLAIDVAEDGGLDADGIEVDGDIGAVTINVGEGADFSGYIGTSSDGDIGDVTMTVGSEGIGELWIGLSGGSLGNVTVSALGDDASAGFYGNTLENDVGNITVNAEGVSAYVDFGFEASGGSIGDITFNIEGEGAEGLGYFSAGDWESTGSGDSQAGNIGNVAITVNGEDARFSGSFDASGGDIGNVNISVAGDGAILNTNITAMSESRDMDDDGDYDDYAFGGNIGDITVDISDGASGVMQIAASGGGIGDITVSVDGADSTLEMYVSAGSNEYSGSPDNNGDIGNLTFNLSDGGRFSGSFDASGGQIGDVTLTATGEDTSAGMNIEASWMSGNGDDSLVKGGDIGNVLVDIDGGAGTEIGMNLFASGGNIGTVDYTLNGDGASGFISLNAQYTSGGGTEHGGEIGDMTFNIGDDADFNADIFADVAVGAITITGGESISGNVTISGGWVGGSLNDGVIGDMTIDLGESSDFTLSVSGWAGDVGSVTATVGNNGDADFLFDNVSGNIGDVSVDGGNGSILWVNFSGSPGDIGDVILTGGDSSASAGVVATSANSIDSVDASAWLGELFVDLDGVVLGTTIKAGDGNSDITGTEGSDNIFLGDGDDEVNFDATPTAADEIFNFATGTGNDVLDVVNATTLETLLTVDTAVDLTTGDIQGLIDIAGGEDITTAAGLLAALDGGEYGSITVNTDGNTATFLTAASSSATTWYVFEAAETDTDAQFDSVTLVGVINADGDLSDIVLGNFS